jgi:putative oxidoreductase
MMDSPVKQRLFTSLEWLCRIVVAATFLLAAVPKILDPLAFSKAIANYRVVLPLIGQDYVYPVAIVLPSLEFIAAIALFFNFSKRAASLACGAMLIMFIGLISQAVLRGLNIDCGCFGNLPASKLLAKQVGIEKILEDVLWLAMCVFVFVRRTVRPVPASTRVFDAVGQR